MRIAVLSDADVKNIRSEYANGVTQVKLAEKYGVTQSHISRIVRGVRRQSVS
jgi:predicted transcriptional regulator